MNGISAAGGTVVSCFLVGMPGMLEEASFFKLCGLIDVLKENRYLIDRLKSGKLYILAVVCIGLSV